MWWNEGHPGKNDGQGQAIANTFARIAFRQVPADRSRALSRDQIRQLPTDKQIPLRERTFWTMLYETGARVKVCCRWAWKALTGLTTKPGSPAKAALSTSFVEDQDAAGARLNRRH